MYNLIIVDDESGTHLLLKDAIEKLIGGFKVIGTFLNGAEAVEYLENNNNVDVILTDIKMPLMDGIELCKYVYENYSQTKMVIISGYSDFNYAKQAFKYNVTDYLLKAVDIKELAGVLKKIKSELDFIRYNAAEKEMLAESYCVDLLMGIMKSDEIIREYRKLGIAYSEDDVLLSIYKISYKNYEEIINDKWNYESEYFFDAISAFVQSVVNGIGSGTVVQIYADKQQMIIGIFSDKILVGFEKSICDNLKEILGLGAECSVVILGKKLEDVSNNTGIFNSHEIYKIMLSYVKMVDAERAKIIISRLMELRNVEESGFGKDMEMLLQEGNIDDTYEKIRTKYNDDEIIATAKEYIKNNFNKDISRNDIADVVYFNAAYFSRYFKQQTGIALGDYICSVRMNHAVEFLNQNSKIQDVAKKCGFKNVRHFQRRFKTYTGYSPSDYRKVVLKKY